MKKIVFGIVAMFIAFSGIAQNMVVNGSFEELDGKVKGPGQLALLVLDWDDARDAGAADLYSALSKKDEVSAPLNARGSAEPWEGDNYAGILCYSEREAEPRSYLMNKLDKTLIPGKKYCVKFNISLSQISKYGCNNIGVHFGSTKMKNSTIQEDGVTPQVLPLGTGVYKNQGEWKTVCLEFTAEGTEKYMTIGNFAPQADVSTIKMRRPREFNQTQSRDAYYFIDDVSVINSSHLDEPCMCIEQEDKEELQVVYKQNLSEDHEMTPEATLKLKKFFFETGKFELTEAHKMNIDDVASIMMANPNLSIELVGHTDDAEAEMYSKPISVERSKAVYDYLMSKGVPSSRMSHKGVQDSSPQASGETAQSRAQNRRVEIIVK